ncbi:hypothetical protein BG015_003322 [Linnemannia schmuckeri]|uniref:Lectin n=1 Tax=Linnemannia schmuckeri TaxID=64567 RepID=A0A9P5RPB6_9FUNG|nr:hypothetical protein BG015_003322 [Linnemannia schmuckeri]
MVSLTGGQSMAPVRYNQQYHQYHQNPSHYPQDEDYRRHRHYCVLSIIFGLCARWQRLELCQDPKEGLQDIILPFSMAKTPYKNGHYFAQRFNFHGIKDAGTTTKHRNCYPGTDGGLDVSCAVDTKDNYRHAYNIIVENIHGNTWRGTLIDTVNKKATVTGEWTLSKGAGKTVNGQAAIYHPTSKTKGVKGSKVIKVYEYGDCVGQAGYAVKKRSTGYDIKVGF